MPGRESRDLGKDDTKSRGVYFAIVRSSVPMILIPRQSDKECIPSNQATPTHLLYRVSYFALQLSSIGFVGLVLSLVNAAMNIAQNVNSNNNDRFDNDEERKVQKYH